jgi:hypothetical protein
VRAGVIGRLSRSSSLRIERPVPEMERLRSLRLNRRGVPSTPPDPSSQTEWGADPNALDACYEHINRARYLIPLIRDISGPAQTRPTHGCNKTRREYVSAAVMHDLGIEPRNSGVVRQKPDHDDRRVWRLKVTFHHNHRHAFVIRNIVARQLVQDAPPGPVMISARGCPLSSCQRACATKASAFSSSHRSRRTSAIACTRAASATADTLMPSSFALSSALASSVTDVFLLATAFIVLRSGFIPQRYTAIACGPRSTTRSNWTSATEVICGGAPGQRGERRRLPTNGLGAAHRRYQSFDPAMETEECEKRKAPTPFPSGGLGHLAKRVDHSDPEPACPTHATPFPLVPVSSWTQSSPAMDSA